MSDGADIAVVSDSAFTAEPTLHLKSLDPRARLVTGLLLIIQLVLIPMGYALILMGLTLALFVYMGRPPLKRLALGLVTVVWMLALTLVLHAFTTPGHILWTVPGVNWIMTLEGLQNGLLLAGRLASLVLLGVTLSLSVTALEAIRAMDVLLHPLARLGVPTGSFSLLLGMTLRFVPSLYEEALILRKALRARGWNPGKGILSRIKAWIPLFIPLLANALRRADDLAETLVLRGYDPKAVRTSYGLSEWRKLDSVAVLIALTPSFLWVSLTLFA